MVENEARPNPDELLARLIAAEESKKHGKLKIFLGYAAGVGKTYSMLESARQRIKELDVVIALVETHGRTETEALLQGFEIIPRKTIPYRGVNLTDLDVDAVLRRKPQLVLIDELAHTNAPDSRHPKRYQDVEEIIDAGIDVYTTLNVQHIESLQDVVAQITGIWIRETVPDSIIDRASEIELVDLPPEELIKRLKEGKVYIQDQVARAIDEFFRKGNLTALRELSMRKAADRVDEQVRVYMGEHAIKGSWPTSEKILVCIGSGPESGSLVRAGRRLATQLGSEWIAVHVETPFDLRLSPDTQERLSNYLRLAGRMGAKVVSIQGNSVAVAVADYAVKNHITKIVVAKSRRRITRGFRPSISDRLLQLSDNYDVQVIAGPQEKSGTKTTTVRRSSVNYLKYLGSLGIVGLATLLSWSLRLSLDPPVLVTIFLIGVIVSAVYLGLGPSIIASVLSVLIFDYLFVPPRFTFAVADFQYLLTMLSLLAVSIVISYFTSRWRNQMNIAKQHEQQMTTLYSLGKELAVLNDMDSYLHAIMKSTTETFGSTAMIFLPDSSHEGKLTPHLHGTDQFVDENEYAAAVWAFEHQKEVGYGTDTLPEAKARYVPLTTARGIVGILALSVPPMKNALSVDKEQLLAAYADLAAVAIEGILLTEESRKVQLLQATERLQTTLINSISHDLRTPLVAIIGTLSSLKEESLQLDESARKNLIEVALQEGDRLNRLLSNLLDMSRIESGTMKLAIEPSEVQDLLGSALEQIGNRRGNHPVRFDIAPGLPYVYVDSGLIVQAFSNVLDNAFKYSQVGSPVDIIVKRIENMVQIEIADRGEGIPSQDLERVFDKFYRLQRRDAVGGTGLGLSIVKGIIETHGGQVSASNRPGGGTIVKILLPVKPEQQGE